MRYGYPNVRKKRSNPSEYNYLSDFAQLQTQAHDFDYFSEEKRFTQVIVLTHET